jgi:arabinogalactan oligomer / maltooligosaccharide transport system substrate-binding protein
MRKWFPILLVLALILGSAPLLATDAAPRAQGLPAVKLVMWTKETIEVMEALGVPKIFEDWAAKNAPGSTLELVNKEVETLRTDFQAAALAGSGAPDLMWTVADHAGPFTAAGLIQPVDDMVDAKLFIPTIVDITKLGGKTYGLPLSAGNHLMLFYNKSMVEKAPETFAELVTISKDLQKENASVEKFSPFAYNQGESFWVFPVAHAFKATEFEADGKTPALDSEGWVKTYQLLHDLKFVEKIEPAECDYNCADGGFKDGTVAMVLNGDWALGGDKGYIAVLGDKLGIAPWPKVEGGGQPSPFVAGTYLMFPNTTKGDNLKVASAFAKFLTTDEETVLGMNVPNGRLPALLSALKSEKITKDPVLSLTSAALLTGVAQPVQPEMRCVFDAVTTQIKAVMNDTLKAEDAAKEAQKVAVGCVAKLK